MTLWPLHPSFGLLSDALKRVMNDVTEKVRCVDVASQFSDPSGHVGVGRARLKV